MANNEIELAQVEAVLDARGALLAENIQKTALDYISRAFCTIRGCAHDAPRRAGIIADAFHNLPRLLQGSDHQACRDETVRAIHALNIKEQAETNTSAKDHVLSIFPGAKIVRQSEALFVVSGVPGLNASGITEDLAWSAAIPYANAISAGYQAKYIEAVSQVVLPGAAEQAASTGVEKYDLSWHLEQAVQELDADSIGLAHNMGEATLDQLHEIVQFADRLKEGALVEMYGREREANGSEPITLILPPEGYTGYRPGN